MTSVLLLSITFLSVTVDGTEGMAGIEYEKEQLQEVYRGLSVGEVDHISSMVYKWFRAAADSGIDNRSFGLRACAILSPYLEIHSPPPDVDSFPLFFA
jgi:hypothetical protein